MNARLTVGIITVIVILLGIFVFINISGGNLASFFGHTGKAVIDQHTFSLFEAKSEKDKEIGLSSKNSIKDDQAMIFLFDKPDTYGFWMKNMKFPIDIVYIRNKKITTIFPNVPNPKSPTDQLPVYTPTTPADTVIEFNAGVTQKDNIHVGDPVTISL